MCWAFWHRHLFFLFVLFLGTNCSNKFSCQQIRMATNSMFSSRSVLLKNHFTLELTVLRWRLNGSHVDRLQPKLSVKFRSYLNRGHLPGHLQQSPRLEEQSNMQKWWVFKPFWLSPERSKFPLQILTTNGLMHAWIRDYVHIVSLIQDAWCSTWAELHGGRTSTRLDKFSWHDKFIEQKCYTTSTDRRRTNTTMLILT